MKRARLFFSLGATSLLAAAACAQKPTAVPVRSLERSGASTIVCLDPDTAQKYPGYAPEGCGAKPSAKKDPDDPTKTTGSGETTRPFALVLQLTRGEVAVLDVLGDAVIDSDPATPGAGFLPVGASPVDITSTRGGAAAFVATAETGKPGLYALPTSKIRTGSPNLLTWPACKLPGRPGAVTMAERAKGELCEGDNFAKTLPQKDPWKDRVDLSLVEPDVGRQKILVTLPDTGDLLVVDAQTLLDREPGTFDVCPIERRYPLQVELPQSQKLEQVTSGPACPSAPELAPSAACPGLTLPVVSYPKDAKSRPSAFAADTSRGHLRLFVTDEGAPLIHVLDVADPCNVSEAAPLLPTSLDDPNRPVTTAAIAVSPLTREYKQYVYAVDREQASVMVFDVSDDAKARTPLVRPRPDLYPYSAADRLNLGSPVRALTFVTLDRPVNDGTGSLNPGQLCDPTQGASNVGKSFRTHSDYAGGAGPRVLRGTFAVVTLTNGSMVVVDVEDYDAACRRYKDGHKGSDGEFSGDLPSWAVGCEPYPAACGPDVNAIEQGGVSGERSCRVVVPHEVRIGRYVLTDPATGPGYPNLIALPVLQYQGGTVRSDDSDEGREAPKMLGVKNGAQSTWTFGKAPGQTVVDADPTKATRSFYVTDSTDPRIHFNEDWTVTYEGGVPGFAGKVGRLNPATKADERGFFDGNAYFCGNGVVDVDAARVIARRTFTAKEKADDPGLVDAFATTHSDQLEITSGLLDESDPYWGSVKDTCSYQRCLATFGTSDFPTLARSFPIREAFEDRVLLGDEITTGVVDATDPAKRLAPSCCFPTLMSYRVRARQTWIAQGSASGFLHRMTVDPNTGRCIEAGVDPATGEPCDATLRLRVGRVYEDTSDDVHEHGDPIVFHNPWMYFVVHRGTKPSLRDMQFTWTTGGGFLPLAIYLGRGATSVDPMRVVGSPALGDNLLVTDASLQGVQLVDMASLTILLSFY